jgi:HAD superfamily hydrolase (TIGR01509 family)
VARERVAIFDVDGTLVDSTYHHALAWQRAFRAGGISLSMWRIHRQIGKGGDRLVPDLAGEQAEREQGDALRAAQRECFHELIGEVEPLAGARELLMMCAETGWRVAVASSGRADEVAHYLRLLDAEGLPDAVISSADVDTTKPAPDMLTLAHERAGGDADPRAALVIGDATWDCEAARRGGMTPVGVLSGGFCRQELLDAGAEAVFSTLDELRRALDALMPVR